MAGNDQGASQGVVGKVCPKCGYTRKADEPVPETRCPKCRVLYAKAEQEAAEKKAPEAAPQVKSTPDAALTPCPDCGHQVSQKAESCPKCGAPLQKPVAPPAPPADLLKATEAVLKSAVALIVLFGVFSFFFGDDDEGAPQPEAAAEERVLTPAEERERRISRQFSAWDGAHHNLKKLVKASLHDPDSFEHVISRSWDQGDHLVVSMEYRAANGFGALRRAVIKAKVTLDGDIIEIMDNYTL